MIQEDKELLLRDLCTRLPYGVKIEHIQSGFIKKLHNIDVFKTYNKDDTVKDYLCHTNFFGNKVCKIEYFKPYLFPLSSMTEEQKTELNDTLIQLELKAINNEIEHCKVAEFEIDFYNKNMFDYRGLIDKELALDATNKNIY